MQAVPETYEHLLSSLPSCPFCDIEDRKIIIEYASAYMTIATAPYHEDHLLIVPKRHVESFLKLDAEEYGEISALCRLGVKMLKKLGHKDVSVLVREGKTSGKSIPHLHYHVVPDVIIHSTTQEGVRHVLDIEIQYATVERLREGLQ